MANKVYVGVNDKARQVKNIYIGVNGEVSTGITNSQADAYGAVRAIFDTTMNSVVYNTSTGEYEFTNTYGIFSSGSFTTLCEANAVDGEVFAIPTSNKSILLYCPDGMAILEGKNNTIVKKFYGENIAHKVKKVYIGVNGVARLAYSTT